MDALHTLQPRVLLDSGCLEYFMLWTTLEKFSGNAMWYVCMDLAKSCIAGEEIPDGDIDAYRSLMEVRLPAAPKPIVMICHWSNHYFVVVLDYQKHTFYILGKQISINLGRSIGDLSDLEGWNGGILWYQISRLFGWGDLGAIDPLVIQTFNWQQVRHLFRILVCFRGLIG
jgi:hypothetical protein